MSRPRRKIHLVIEILVKNVAPPYFLDRIARQSVPSLNPFWLALGYASSKTPSSGLWIGRFPYISYT
jgi:hypothetical protein